jgi:hypothetical protein
MKWVTIAMLLVLASCNERIEQPVQGEPDYGYTKDKHNTIIYKCLNKDCTEKRAILVMSAQYGCIRLICPNNPS